MAYMTASYFLLYRPNYGGRDGVEPAEAGDRAPTGTA
jgi:hypothetical protein